MNNSLIFKSVDTQLTGTINKISIFRKSFSDLSRDVHSGQGVFTTLFSNLVYKDGVTKKDVKCISDFMNQIKQGIPVGQAWKNTMTYATVAGKQMAVNVKAGKVELSALEQQMGKVATTSKLASAAMSMAFINLAIK